MVRQAPEHLEHSFRELYDRTYDRVYAFVLRRVLSEDEARDVVSDTWMSVWRRMRDVPADSMLADAWVFGTARRVIANHRRSAARRDRLSERLLAQPMVEGGRDADDRGLLLRALDGLPSKHREVLQLATWDELTHAQIGHVLGCSENAVGIRLHRARAALRRAYDELAERSERS